MKHEHREIDEITARFRSENSQLRRRTMLLTLVPVVAGVVVVGAAYWSVQQAQLAKDGLDAEIELLRDERSKLDEEVTALRWENAQLRARVEKFEARFTRLEEAILEN